MADDQYGVDLILPEFVRRSIVDPAPPVSASSKYLQITAPGTSGSVPPPSIAASISAEVLQQYEVDFQFSVPRLTASTTDRALAFPFKSMAAEDGYAVPSILVWVSQPCYPQNSRILRGYTWEISFETGKLETIQLDDNGPAFTNSELTQVTVCPALPFENGGFSYDIKNEFAARKMHGHQLDSETTAYEVFNVDSAYVIILCKLVFSRRYSRTEWNLFSCGRTPAPKSSLLESAARTGDVVLLGGEGVEVPAHSAILIDMPFFEAKLREEWSGSTAWNMHNKLRLRLPCSISKEALDACLQYVYGDTRSLYGIEPWVSPMLKEMLTLADACGLVALCDDIVGLVMVTSANVDEWLPWLMQEHSGVNLEPIRKQVGEVLRDRLQTALQGQTLTVEQLAVITLSLARPEALEALLLQSAP